ncbi:MAG: type II toxin-antitoxin system RelE/ParE family toxin [Planctomycetota bacterium]|nr:type II toxin-antitoxin system RelE/ParE family toxin [Planctomycetota bacterium]
MTYHVAVLPTAQRDLRRILRWVAERSPRGAARLLAAFENRLHELGERPASFGLAPESAHMVREIREFFFKTPRGRRYRGVFHVVGQTVEILHVRGPGQDFLAQDELGQR